MLRLFLCALGPLLLQTGCTPAPQQYALACSTPPAHWRTPKDGIADLRTIDMVQLGKHGALHWNRRPVTAETLDKYLAASGNADSKPQILLVIDPAADCAAVRALRARMDKAATCAKDRLCGEGSGWRRWPGAKAID